MVPSTRPKPSTSSIPTPRVRATNRNHPKPTPCCQKCNLPLKKMTQLQHVGQHAAKDLGIMRYSCNHCQYKTYSISSVKKHIYCYHEGVEIDEYTDRLEELREVFDKMSIDCYTVPLRPKKESLPTSRKKVGSSKRKYVKFKQTMKIKKDRGLKRKIPSILNDYVDNTKKDKVKLEIIDRGYENGSEISDPEERSGSLDYEINKLYENYRVQKNWTTSQLVENVEIVARIMEFSEERISDVGKILVENILKILKKMKFDQVPGAN